MGWSESPLDGRALRAAGPLWYRLSRSMVQWLSVFPGAVTADFLPRPKLCVDEQAVNKSDIPKNNAITKGFHAKRISERAFRKIDEHAERRARPPNQPDAF